MDNTTSLYIVPSHNPKPAAHTLGPVLNVLLVLLQNIFFAHTVFSRSRAWLKFLYIFQVIDRFCTFVHLAPFCACLGESLCAYLTGVTTAR